MSGPTNRATTGPGRDESGDVDALITDRYLELILAAHARGADSAPTPSAPGLTHEVRTAADLLSRDLPRLHPSFRFEEALAARLAAAATRMRSPLTAGETGQIVALESMARLPRRGLDDEQTPVEGRPHQRVVIGRPLLLGGALASAALSVLGAAYVAWRIGRGRPGAMARAVRAVARTRPA